MTPNNVIIDSDKQLTISGHNFGVDPSQITVLVSDRNIVSIKMCSRVGSDSNALLIFFGFCVVLVMVYFHHHSLVLHLATML